MQTIRENLSNWVGQSTQIALKFHQKRMEPLFYKLIASVWGEKRLHATKEFNPDTDISVEERWTDIGLIAATSSTALAVGGLFIPIFGLLSVPGLLIGSVPVYKDAYESLRYEKKITNNLLAALLQTALIGSGQLFLGNITPLAYFFNEKSKLMAKRELGQTLVSLLTTQQQLVTVAIVSTQTDDQQGETGIEITKYTEIQKRLDRVTKGEIVVIYAGEMIPIDGVIADGFGVVDERVLTGESQPIEKGRGALVFASTVVLSGKIFVQLQSSGQETLIGQVEEILNHTLYHVQERELWAQTLANSLALPTLVASGMVLPFLGIGGAMALIDANPLYRLSISGNTSLINFLNITSQENILVKDGRVLEAMEEVDIFIFDKTGTLTEDRLLVDWVYAFDGYKETDVIYYAALAEQKQSHPIAQAILAKAQAWAIVYSPVDAIEYKLGLGLVLALDDYSVYVGSPRFIVAEGISLSAALGEIIDTSQSQGKSLVLVAIDHVVIGAIELAAAARAEAAALVTKLRTYPQVNAIMIVSGDHEAPTRRIARELGIDDYYAEKFPEDKAQLIKLLQEQGHTVCFVGDGINDAIALKQADISISLRGASSLATGTAQVILLDDNLENIDLLLDLTHRFEKNQKRSMALVLGTSGLALVGALFWQVKLGQAIVLTTSGFLMAIGVSFGPWLHYRNRNKRTPLPLDIRQLDPLSPNKPISSVAPTLLAS